MAVKTFAITGVAGYVAPRHLKAIKETGNRLVAACDPHDSVGILDQYGMDVRYFPETERFDRHLSKLQRGPEAVDYVSICSPNYLHDAHCRLALRVGADAICEKPLVINPWNLDALQELEQETGRRIYTVMQLRYHPEVMKLRDRLTKEKPGEKHMVYLAYLTPRGSWYDTSWKGSPEKSGGVETNIGVHLWDLLIGLFGVNPNLLVFDRMSSRSIAGVLDFKLAQVEFFLSIDEGNRQRRTLTIDGDTVDLSAGFTDLHTKVYEEILAGRGLGIEDARPAIELAYQIRNSNGTD